MSKTRNQILDYLFYVSVRLFGCALQIMPAPWSLAVVRALAWLAYSVDRRHREVAFDNLRHAFPGRYDDEQLKRMTLGVYQHFATLLLELLLIPRRYASRAWREAQQQKAPPALAAAVATGRPILIVTAHYGNWELASFMLRACGIKTHVVARPLDNPHIDDMVRRFRESCGHKVLSKHGDLRRMRAVLDDGGVICTLADQDAGSRGMFVDFFGRPASTHRVIAHLAQKTGALIVVVGTHNPGGVLDHSVHVTDVIDPRDYVSVADADFAITQRMTRGVEALVRLDPAQYLWLHRRWKHTPPVAKVAPALAAAA